MPVGLCIPLFGDFDDHVPDDTARLPAVIMVTISSGSSPAIRNFSS